MSIQATSQALEEVKLLATAVCKAHLPGDYQQAATQHFLDWGDGWFENKSFSLHAYSYMQGCRCGAEDQSDQDLRSMLCTCPEGQITACNLENILGVERVDEGWNLQSPQLDICWYKYLGRSSKMSQEFDPFQLRAYFDTLIKSLESDPGEIYIGIDNWPIWGVAKDRHQQALSRFLSLDSSLQNKLKQEYQAMWDDILQGG